MTPELRKLVQESASREHLEHQAVEQGMVRLNVQSLALARAGAILLGEVFRARLD